MKLKIFSFLAVFFAAAFTANAQSIAGTYSGLMIVEVIIPDSAEVHFPNQNIIITDEEGGLVKLSILNFSFLELELGNLDVTGISTATNGGVTTLSKEGWSDGPAVDLGTGPGNELPTIIMLNSAGVTSEGVLTLDLSVDLYVPEIVRYNVANVTFNGSAIPAGIFSPNANRINIYSNVAAGEIVVEGFENADFSIFNLSGVLVKQGNLSTETINVSALNSGAYILNVNGASALFIRK